MERFLSKHAGILTGQISSFDRVLFKGYLPISHACGMENFLSYRKILLKDFKKHVLRCSERVKAHVVALALREGRPYEHLSLRQRKEDRARQIAERDGVQGGLVCAFSVVEQCQSFKLCYGPGRPRLKNVQPRCLCFYVYLIDRQLGLIHLRIQSWFPFTIQVCVHGHQWLCRQLERRKLSPRVLDNALVATEDWAKAQAAADRFMDLPWPKILAGLAARINPLLKEELKPMSYYWVIDQAEYATDLVFKGPQALQELYQKLLTHACVNLGAEDVMSFLGKKLTGHFQGELKTLMKKRWPGARIKHRVQRNWIKMYNKHGFVLRVETVINNPYLFRVRRKGLRKGVPVTDYFPMAKRVSNLRRYAQISRGANGRYLSALACVDNPTEAYGQLTRIGQRITVRCGGSDHVKGRHRPERSYRALNPINPQDLKLLSALMRGEHHLRGFQNREVAALLGMARAEDPQERKRQSARINRLLRLLHAHGLIAHIPRTRRWRLTLSGMAVMNAAIHLAQNHLPELLAQKTTPPSPTIHAKM